MPRTKKTQSQAQDVDGLIESFGENLKKDLHKLKDLLRTESFNQGAVAERMRMAGLLTGGANAVVVSPTPKTNGAVPKASVPKVKKKSSWDNLTPEQRAVRVANLKEIQKRRWASKVVNSPVVTGDSDTTPTATGEALREPTPEPAVGT